MLFRAVHVHVLDVSIDVTEPMRNGLNLDYGSSCY